MQSFDIFMVKNVRVCCSYHTLRMFSLYHHNRYDTCNIIWASTQENLSSGCPNNKSANQPVHSRSLISASAIRFLKRILASLVTCKISIF